MPLKQVPYFLSEDIIEIDADSPAQAQAYARILRHSEKFEDVVPGMDKVAAIFDPISLTQEAVQKVVQDLLSTHSETDITQRGKVTIPVLYGAEYGPDFNLVCEQTGLTGDQLIELHTSQTYCVDMVGFTPGFAYIGGCPFSVPRLSHPRASVEAGSIGVTGGKTGVYALAGPGGWPIIGRSQLKLFDPKSSTPFCLSPQMKVRFEAVLK